MQFKSELLFRLSGGKKHKKKPSYSKFVRNQVFNLFTLIPKVLMIIIYDKVYQLLQICYQETYLKKKCDLSKTKVSMESTGAKKNKH